MSRPIKRVQPMRAAKAKRVKTEPIPELPDDILRMIIEELPTADRAPLSLVSKRFRNLDLAVGKRKFDAFNLFLGDDGYTINAGHASGFYDINERYDETTEHTRMLFSRASVGKLEFTVESPQDEGCALALSTAFHSLRVNKIKVFFRQNILQESAFNFLSGLKFNRNCVDLVQFCWNFTIKPNEKNLKKQLLQLPKMQKLEVIYTNEGGVVPEEPLPVFDQNVERYLVDGATMVHLVRQTDEVFLRSVDCTAQELLEAFEIFLDSPIDNKFVKMSVAQSTVDELFAAAEENDGLMVSILEGGIRILRDVNRRCELYANNDWKDIFDCICLDVYKIDANEKALSEHIPYN